jgi:hypothetical protein
MSESHSNSNCEKRQLLLESYKLYMERLNSELSIHWTRINIGVVALTAAIGGYGALWKEALATDRGVGVFLMIAPVGVLIAILAMMFRRVLLAGKNWCDIAEVRVVALERELWRVNGNTSIYMCHEYDQSWKRTLKMNPSITDSYNCVLIVIVVLLTLSNALALFHACALTSIAPLCNATRADTAAVIAGNWNVLVALVIVTIPVLATECYIRSTCLRYTSCERKAVLRKMTRDVQRWMPGSRETDSVCDRNEVMQPCACKRDEQ